MFRKYAVLVAVSVVASNLSAQTPRVSSLFGPSSSGSEPYRETVERFMKDKDPKTYTEYFMFFLYSEIP